MTRAEAKWAIANPETLKAMADGEAEWRYASPHGTWSPLPDNVPVSDSVYEFRKKPDPAPPKEPKRWLIWSIKHNLWWGVGQTGYYATRQYAGRYTFEEACECVRRSNQHGQDAPGSAMIEDPDQ